MPALVNLPATGMLHALASVLVSCAMLASALDNGLGLTPPRGWRSWNSYPCEDSSNTTFTGGDIISDIAMRGAMHAVLDTTRFVLGVKTNLSSLGFDWVSMVRDARGRCAGVSHVSGGMAVFLVPVVVGVCCVRKVCGVGAGARGALALPIRQHAAA